MAGSVVDLSDQTVQLPSVIIVDTNIIIERIATSFGYPPSQTNGPRAYDFFQRLIQSNATGIVTPMVHAELAHVLVKLRYQIELRRNRAVLVQQYGTLSSWIDLYKRDPSILQSMRPDFARLTRSLVATGIHLIDVDEPAQLLSGRTPDQELIELMCRYGLDSNDATILLEAQRIPVLDIATFDADLLRAQADFTIYTWL